MRKLASVVPVLALAGLVIAVQLLTRALHVEYLLTQLIMTAYLCVVILGLCLVMGYAGQISLGHAAFFAIGGYTSAILTTTDVAAFAAASGLGRALLRAGILVSRSDAYGRALVTVTPGAAFLAALSLAGIAAFLIGYPGLRLKGHYLAMATLGFGLIVYRILLGSEFAGSADGVTGVPPWTFLPNIVIGGDAAHRVVNYYVAWGFALATLLLLTHVVHSRVGRALRAIHENEMAANAMGINTARLKLQAFVLSAVLAAAAGSLLTHYNRSIGPSQACAEKSVRYVALVAAGGMANLWGALLVSAALTFVSLRGHFGSFDHAVFGGLLIVIVSLAPEGPLKPIADGVRRLFASSSATQPGESSHESA